MAVHWLAHKRDKNCVLQAGINKAHCLEMYVVIAGL